ncbi:MAG: hypothetical protein CMG24_04440 [Candidatus Marinimicrobia bacterium]|nr:hypothetical protein [Candidatus Neomarinimicrobiota bacterium]|tara:strand:- start:5017 stop:5229 length:213 start_codon:yes stop_codon:yes gene_type:complete
MFNVNLLNNPGKQVKGMDSKIIVNKKSDFGLNSKYEYVKVADKQSNKIIKFLVLLIFCCFAIGYYYLIML